MANHIPHTTTSWLLLISFTCALLITCSTGQSEGDQQIYIVYMGDILKGDFSASSLHTSMLEEVVGSRASESLLHSYQRSFNGFVAKLTEEEKKKLAAALPTISSKWQQQQQQAGIAQSPTSNRASNKGP
ncbi:hypothetical protein ACSBR1_007727 [Camellia fascicularis]